MDDDIRSTFEHLVDTDAESREICGHILASGISCYEAGLACERCGPGSEQSRRLLDASVLPRFI
jgi:hypothetical protein